MRKPLKITLFCCFLIPLGFAQVTDRYLEIGVLGGQMLDIYPNFPSRGLHKSVILSYAHRKSGLYNSLYRKPTAGVTLSFHDFGNPQILGYGVGLQFEMTFAQKLGERLSLIEKFRPGIVYSTNPYHHLKNTKNIVIGSHFSALMGTTLGLKYQLGDRLWSTLEGSIWHSSNGHTALPNVGMNSPLLMLSVQYRLSQGSDTSQNFIANPAEVRGKQWSFILGLAYGINEAGGTTQPVNTPLYDKRLLSLGIGYRFRKIHRISLAIEGYYDQTYRLWNESQEWVDESASIQSSAIMLMFGHEFIYNRWALVINGGVNVYNPTLNRLITEVEANTTPNKIKRWVPGRFAIRHYLWQHNTTENAAYIQCGIKSNFGQADFLEFGLGFNFGGPSIKHDGCFGGSR